jgi:hypothetical protein
VAGNHLNWFESQLAQMPDTRADVVARGRRLVADANYPSLDIIRVIADNLAAQWIPDPSRSHAPLGHCSSTRRTQPRHPSRSRSVGPA